MNLAYLGVSLQRMGTVFGRQMTGFHKNASKDKFASWETAALSPALPGPFLKLSSPHSPGPQDFWGFYEVPSPLLASSSPS